MPTELLERGIANGAGSDERASFCATMAEGLHALAQPLTILRSAVAACRMPGATESSRSRYMELSSEQVERTCGLFELLQDLVIANQVKADCEPFDLSGLLAGVVQDRAAELQAAGIEFKVVTPSGLGPVLGDVSRTLQAILAALNIAISLSEVADVNRLEATVRSGYVELTIESRRNHGRLLNSSQRLSLALAEANVRSQGGEYKWKEDPFSVFLALPLRDYVQ